MGWGKGASALLCLFLCLISETFGFCPVSSQSFLRQRQPVRSACFGLSVGVSPSPDEVVVERVAVSPSKVPSFDGLPSSLLSQEPLPSAATILRGDKDALDEAWALTDKFYLDRSFNGKDWSAVREKYRGLVNRYKPKNIGPLVGDMMNELGDPFSRWIDAQMYSDLQKFDLLGIGSPLSKGPDQKVRFIAPPVVGSPGEKAGVKSGDIVLEIAGSPVEGKNGFDILALVEKLPDPTYSIKVQPSDGRPQFEFVS
uniref:Tricorn protease C1 domain-containing protein n=1 Tax=Chromera velia CCMP2878 TaxID=1169474 RepID=A0A0G4HPM4_9ALVE|eukprot:Cvel_29989.t1-p1 / transcript=Cvel_29989.t1 / gene=Cvel_29989 / organism=Chromera_velia_CCMP2878 / gene_product=C-terminal processing peptidase, chloroplastic, putative / transcript_product=C-terminal processing peptidase, chloroplastic, putative / location=Cvel_scaffold4207:8963-10707(+) / protein_length=254 / sequence_SO=supercontig / SO=protein_coding / is_pseudo=false